MKNTLCRRAVFGTLIAAIGSCNTPAIPNFSFWPINTSGYAIELLPTVVSASYARGEDVYFVLPTGSVYRADDNDLSKPWVAMGKPFDCPAHLLFASKSGVLFASPNVGQTWRLAEPEGEWTPCLDVPCWRMDEDDQGNLYIGNYTKDPEHVATLYKSTDSGATWSVVFSDSGNHHLHTVRWDDSTKRLYIAFGDGATRGQAYSDDRGATFRTIDRGPREGHTDVAFTNNFVFWASDDASGRVFRTKRFDEEPQTLMAGSQYMWFAVARDREIYIGTVPSDKKGGERAYVLASADEGNTWTKLLESDMSTGPYSDSFTGESRELSGNGWLYVTKLEPAPLPPASYRIRHVSEPVPD